MLHLRARLQTQSFQGVHTHACHFLDAINQSIVSFLGVARSGDPNRPNGSMVRRALLHPLRLMEYDSVHAHCKVLRLRNTFTGLKTNRVTNTRREFGCAILSSEGWSFSCMLVVSRTSCWERTTVLVFPSLLRITTTRGVYLFAGR